MRLPLDDQRHLGAGAGLPYDLAAERGYGTLPFAVQRFGGAARHRVDQGELADVVHQGRVLQQHQVAGGQAQLAADRRRQLADPARVARDTADDDADDDAADDMAGTAGGLLRTRTRGGRGPIGSRPVESQEDRAAPAVEEAFGGVTPSVRADAHPHG